MTLLAPQSTSTVFALTPRQHEALDLFAGPQRHTLLVGGGRSGKTFFIVRAIVIRALRSDGSRHCIWRLRFNACRASIWLDTFKKVMRLCFPEVKITEHTQDGYISLPNDSEIWFAGLDDAARVEKILGMEFATLYFGECSQIPYSSVLVALTRLAQKCEGLTNRAYYDLNPVTTKHWTYSLFVEHKDPVSRLPLKRPNDYRWMRMNPVDNMANIDDAYLEQLESLPERYRKRFMSGEYVSEIDGALWTLERIESQRITIDNMPNMDRITVNVDPSGCMGKEDKRSDEIGLTVTGKCGDRGYLLADHSGRYSPERWGALACSLYHEWQADTVVGEINYGGDMVRSTVQAADRNVPFKKVTATRGKVVRADPISALYEKGEIFHVGTFALLEDQLCNFSVSGYQGERSPDRADSAIWGFTELMLGETDTGLLEFYKEQNKLRRMSQDEREAMV